ncbi:GNAT family N-acetyltransferase [Alkalihalobacillus sp. CinArs1]|uniref:GNAT family N-acetyltransferase n=1 Tax=Alkalihalobacillus sp. CinArs1 TaxID=2995314 RepID=UPI0022DDFC89|nr:GNAT family protein [Alkalihalobacillus sp. CinArs1]
MDTFPTLLTSRLVLTALHPNDVDALFSIFSDPLVTYYDTGDTMKTRTQANHYINAFKDPSSISTTNSIRFAVRLKSNNQLIGTAGFQNWDRNSSKAEIGAVLSRDYWRGGYGLEAARSIIDFGFSKMRLHKIYAQTIQNNESAVKRLKQLGFKKEGCFKEHIFLHQKYYDVLVYSIFSK